MPSSLPDGKMALASGGKEESARALLEGDGDMDMHMDMDMDMGTLVSYFSRCQHFPLHATAVCVCVCVCVCVHIDDVDGMLQLAHGVLPASQSVSSCSSCSQFLGCWFPATPNYPCSRMFRSAIFISRASCLFFVGFCDVMFDA